MSDNESEKRPKPVDSTHTYNFEVTKEEFENTNFPDSIKSSAFSIDIDGEETQWYLRIYPKGSNNHGRGNVDVTLYQKSEGDIYKVSFEIAIKTPDGYWPTDFLRTRDDYLYYGYTDENSEVSPGWGYILCTTEDFQNHFVENKVILVATLVIDLEDDKYRNRTKASPQFVDNVRSISSQMNLTDFTIISGDKRFPCHRVLLAVRSEYFEAMFRNEPTKTELKVEEASELVEIVLEFMCKGRIPKDIDDNAMDLILVADMYGLDILTMACEKSLMKNLSPDNVVETLIVLDKVNHVSKQENRLKVLTYINKEADKVIKSKDWKKFVQNYPDLITEAFVLKCSK